VFVTTHTGLGSVLERLPQAVTQAIVIHGPRPA